MVGGLSFIAGAVLFLLFTAAQLSGDAGPTNNLGGFIGVLVICPLPLLLLGLVLGGGGIFILRGGKTKDEESTEIKAETEEEDN